MATSPNFTLRVVISDTEIRKLRLDEKPCNIDQLNDAVRTSLKIEYPFVILYEDTELNNALCTLENMDDLKAFDTIRVVEVKVVEDTQPVSGISASSSSACSSEIYVNANVSETSMRKLSGSWPDEFSTPKFDHDIEVMLSRGDVAFKESGKLLVLTKSAKGSILQKLANTIYDIKAYPTESEYADVARALIAKHPCLRETGSQNGYDGWRNSIQFKMGNFRNEIRKAGGEELLINGGRRSCYRPDLPSGRSGIKKPRRAESNFLPNFPSGQSSDSQQVTHTMLQEECKKVRPDHSIIQSLMLKTFALRRQKIVKECLPVAVMQNEWPALFFPVEICAEFARVVNVRADMFYTALDSQLSKLEKFFTDKANSNVRIRAELDKFQSVSSDITARRTFAIRSLCAFLTKPSQVFMEYDEATLEQDVTDDPQPHIVVIGKPYESSKIHIAVESQLVVRNVITFPEAVKLLFCLMFNLNLAYPKDKRQDCYFFEYVQKVIFGLENKKLSAKLTTFLNNLH